MTEKEFQKQVWRCYDQITLADGVKGKVLQVAFNTKSVRAYISGSPEWVKCELIETHTTGRGGDGDDTAIIEELNNKVINLGGTIEHQRAKIAELEEKIRTNYLADVRKGVVEIREGLVVKKKRIEHIERGLTMIEDLAARFAEE